MSAMRGFLNAHVVTQLVSASGCRKITGILLGGQNDEFGGQIRVGSTKIELGFAWARVMWARCIFRPLSVHCRSARKPKRTFRFTREKAELDRKRAVPLGLAGRSRWSWAFGFSVPSFNLSRLPPSLALGSILSTLGSAGSSAVRTSLRC